MKEDSGMERRPALEILQGVSIYWEKRLIYVFLMGFASGLPFLLSGATLSIWLTEAGVSLTAIGLFALVGTPYNLKYLWAPFIDRVPLPMLSKMLGRRRAWMLMIQVGLMASIIGLGLSRPQFTPEITAFLALAVAFFSASQDIVIDAYRIEILDEDQQGAGAAMTQAGYRFGLLASGAGALYLATGIDWSLVYALMAGLVLIGFIAALCAPIPKADKLMAQNIQPADGWFRSAVAAPFVEFFQRNSPQMAVVILVFILLYKFGDAFAGVMANPFYIRIGFSKIEIANVSKIFGVFATLLGVFAGGLVVKQAGILRSLLYCGILQMLSNLMFAAQAAIGPHVGFLMLTIGIENLSGGMGSAAFVAYLSVLCNAAYTGTQFALFTSFMAFGHVGLGRRTDRLGDVFYHLHVCRPSGIVDAAVDDETTAHGASNRPPEVTLFFQTATPLLLNRSYLSPTRLSSAIRLMSNFIEIQVRMCFLCRQRLQQKPKTCNVREELIEGPESF